MKSAKVDPKFSVAAIIALALLMVAGTAFLIAVYRQVQENRNKLAAEFAGYVTLPPATDILGPATISLGESRQPPSVPTVEYKLSLWTRLGYAREEWSEAARQVLQNLAHKFSAVDNRPAASP